ncbi:MAG: HD domain-containing phosphohydrolase [Candidatus Coatesbacteria bacterium]
MLDQARILVVDDDADMREFLSEVLSGEGHMVSVAADGTEALAIVTPAFDLILADLGMPGMDGFELIARVRGDPLLGHIPIVVVTGSDTIENWRTAVAYGADDFVRKPVVADEIRLRVRVQLKLKRSLDELRASRASLEGVVQQRTFALERALRNVTEHVRLLDEARVDTVFRLALAAEARDPDTAGHLRRMKGISIVVAQAMGFPREECETIGNAAMVHDIGKLGIPEGILRSRTDLSAADREIMRSHTVIGAKILAESSAPVLRAGETCALTHHERWDGSGYPNGLRGDAIPLYGRICAVTDVFDALTHERSYKPAFPVEKSVAIMKELKGRAFDPAILSVFLANLYEVVEVAKVHGETVR